MIDDSLLEDLMRYDIISFNFFRLHYGNEYDYEEEEISKIFSKLLELNYITLYSKDSYIPPQPPRYRTNKVKIKNGTRKAKLKYIVE